MQDFKSRVGDWISACATPSAGRNGPVRSPPPRNSKRALSLLTIPILYFSIIITISIATSIAIISTVISTIRFTIFYYYYYDSWLGIGVRASGFGCLKSIVISSGTNSVTELVKPATVHSETVKDTTEQNTKQTR